MTKAGQGALLSGLVLPGLGQIVLKHRLRGALLLLASLACLAVVVWQAIAQATAVMAQLDLGNPALDPTALMQSLSQAGADSAGALAGIASWALLVLWLGGTVDAYLLGRKEDQRDRQ